MFTIRDDTIMYRGKPIEYITPEKRIRAFQTINACSARLASDVEAGGFAGQTSAMFVARKFRLLCINPDTLCEARKCGLLQ